MGIGLGRNPEQTKRSNKKSQEIGALIHAIFHPKRQMGKTVTRTTDTLQTKDKTEKVGQL
jgi:hypothetical protein